eukprot:SAG31_NODE_3429_length_4284_cov_7.544086_2_plen_46_part_00
MVETTILKYSTYRERTEGYPVPAVHVDLPIDRRTRLTHERFFVYR